ncbi:hypothetical protein LWI29_033787 [Acer saccharum]|uniref:C3H1-type domain-containing protein n=1 Tax=Acer saccharum TaxID=4024 RepID=A0AA39VU23_ACESA|nr:hypothetical protein LWI29_033787 [Acer saccharum]KAK1564391.1 hypothetical protein Q3G72_002209 [Acer saccharum]
MQKFVDSIYSNKSSKTPKRRSLNCVGAVSPLMIKYLNSSSSSSCSSVDPFSPPYSGKNSNNSGSPLSAVDGEDVLVMDGILVGSNSGGFYKAEICRSWEDFGKCRFGAKCQFAHGKEEVRPSRMKNKSEICKSYMTGSCLYGSKCRFVHQMITDSALVFTTRTDSPTKPEHDAIMTPRTPLAFIHGPEHTSKASITPTAFKLEQPSSKSPTITIKSEQSNEILNSMAKAVQTGGGTSITNVTGKDKWSPLDDGIEVVLPNHTDSCPPSRENVDAYMDGFLNQPRARRRLPVFAEICPE